MTYDLLRSTQVTTLDAAICVATSIGATSATDGTDPASGSIHYYLVRSRNGCGDNLGAGRSGPACF